MPSREDDGTDTVQPTSPQPAAGSVRPVSAHPGVVLDRYTILERVGSGGMGEVYAAYDGKLDRKVALKLLRTRGEEFETRLVREAQAMARLSHPNVVGVFDTGHVGGRLYLAMEFVRGETLRKWQKSAPRSILELLRAYSEAGQGLAAAHAAGLVHRDFKPDNVLVADDGRIKVTDFGVARAVGERSVASPPLAGPRADSTGARPVYRPPGLPADSTGARPAYRPPNPRGDSTGARPVYRVVAPKSIAEIDSNSPESDVVGTVSASGALESPTTPNSSSLDSPMTAAGTLLGTPGYMAPEQFLSEPIDERTDQFAFCVSLYEALYGERPFAPARSALEDVAEATLLGRVREAPKGTRVPAYIRRVLLRGLAAEREARYPSMRELLHDLARDPAKTRRQVIVAIVSAVAATTLVASAVVQYRRAATGRALVCKGSEEALHGIWDDAKKPELHRAFLATGSPIAADTWGRVEHAVDAYTRGWVAMRTETCEATRVRGLQSDEAMTLRMACLDRRLEGVKAYVDVFSKPDEASVEKAVNAALSLTGLDGCADLAALRAPMPPPEEPAARARVDALRSTVAELKALHDAGKYHDVIERAAPAIKEAEALHYRPVEAELRLWTATAYVSAAKYDEAEPEAVRAVFAAEAGGHHEVAARASGQLAIILAYLARWPESRRWAEYGKAVLEHMGANVEIESLLERALASSCLRTDPEEALRHDERALKLWEKASGTNGAEMGTLYDSIAVAYNERGDYEKATDLYARSVAAFESTLGPAHPALAVPLANHALSAVMLGRYDDAERDIERIRGLSCKDPNSGTEISCKDAQTGDFACDALGTIYLLRGRYSEALAEFEKAMRGNEDTHFGAGFLADEGKALSELGRHKEALAAVRRAVARRESAFDENNPNRAEVYHALGYALRAAGKPGEALAYEQRAATIWSTVKQPSAGLALEEVGLSQLDLHHFAAAAEAFERSAAIVEKAFGPKHPDLGWSLSGLGRAQLALGQSAQAVPNLERAIAIAEAARLAPKLLAETRFALAQAMWQSGSPHDTAHQIALTAKGDAKTAGRLGLAAEIDAWLASHT